MTMELNINYTVDIIQYGKFGPIHHKTCTRNRPAHGDGIWTFCITHNVDGQKFM